MNYYNEFDPFAAAWLRELIAANLIPQGHVDTRSITDISAADLRGYSQCHFFAGIGGWSLALRLAGWPDDRPVWTGSCPCQAFSSAGKGEGFNDPRHLWPVFNRLIGECRPAIVFGEQVEAAVGHGWLDLVATDLEAQGYAFGTAVLGAHSVGSPHRRQRIYWVGSSLAIPEVFGGGHGHPHGGGSLGGVREGQGAGVERGGASGGSALADPGCSSDEQRPGLGLQSGAPGQAQGEAQQRQWCRPDVGRGGIGSDYALGDTDGNGRGQARRDLASGFAAHGEGTADQPSHGGSAWSDSYWLPCRDGKARQVPIEPFVQFMANGISDTMGDVWGSGSEIIQKEVLKHAPGEQNNGSFMRSLLMHARSQAVQRPARGFASVSPESVLLVALCELSRCSQPEFNIPASDRVRFAEGALREMLGTTLQPKASPCSPQERKLEGSPTREFGDAMRGLSPGSPRSDEAEESVCPLPSGIQEERNVPEALSAVEEAWRSILEKGADTWASKRVQDYAAGVLTTIFPLVNAGAFRNRVGLLRGAGNAICVQTAEVFIRASTGDLK